MKIRLDGTQKILLRTAPSGLSRFGRFVMVGVLNSAVGFLLFLLFFNVLEIHYLVANLLVFASWVWFGFELQRRWAFRAEKGRKSFTRFLAMRIPLVPLSTSLIWTMVEVLHLREEFAYILTISLVTAGIYLVSVFWVFRRAEHSK